MFFHVAMCISHSVTLSVTSSVTYHLFIIQQTEKVPTKHLLGPTGN